MQRRWQLSLLTMIGLMCLVATAAAQDADKAKKKAPVTPQIFNLPAEITLTADQQKTFDALKEEYTPKLVEMNKKVDAILTADQKKARKAATEKAKEDKLKPAEQAAAITAALNLTNDQKEKYTAGQKELDALRKEVRAKISELLTPEQREKLPGQPKKKKKAA